MKLSFRFKNVAFLLVYMRIHCFYDVDVLFFVAETSKWICIFGPCSVSNS